jgi:nicotinamide-nucleotide amidase
MGKIGEQLKEVFVERGECVAIAESATGGLVGSLVTDTAGASDFFDRSVVTYTYDAKLQELCVSREALDEEGAVSDPVARGMARGVRDKAGTEWGVSTTGIAGPTGGTEKKPVGTVYVGVAYAGEWGTEASYSTTERFVFDGERKRHELKREFAEAALCELLEEARSA